MKVDRIIVLILLVLIYCSCKKINQEKDLTYLTPDFVVTNILAEEGFSVPHYFLFKDMKAKDVPFDSIISEPVLIFRFGEMNCEDCIISEINIIKQFDYKNKIIGLASYNSTRALMLILQKYKIDFPVYYLSYSASKEILPESLENYGIPYSFIMGTDFIARKTFLPAKELSSISQKYYDMVFSQLNKGKSEHSIFLNENIDLGEIIGQKTYSIKFEYLNNTDKPLVIEDVKSSCSCSTPKWNKIPLEKGQSDELTIMFTPESTGYIMRTIMVFYNQSKEPIKLTFKAFVNNNDEQK
jgi:hypothetical protein